MLCYQVSIGLLFILCVWFIPESPVYLAARAEFDAAEQSLEWLGRKPDSLKFFKEVQTDMHVFDTTLAKSWRQYTDPRVYKPFLACLALMFFFQVKRLKIFSLDTKIYAALSGKNICVSISGVRVQHGAGVFSVDIPRVGRRAAGRRGHGREGRRGAP